MFRKQHPKIVNYSVSCAFYIGFKQSLVDKELNMKALYQDTKPTTFNTRLIKAKAKRPLSTLEEDNEVVALFSGLYKSDQFTTEA
jgi:hypothetical protein